jgi:hypothetical protein
MSSTPSPFLAIGILSLVLVRPICAAEPGDSSEGRLRETLRSTMLQLRDAQSDLANLQAAQAAQADQTKALGDQLVLLKKHSAEDRVATDKASGALKTNLAAQTQEIAQLREALGQWKAAAEKTSVIARTLDAQCAKQAAENAALQRQVDDLELRNIALFRIASEILTRYEKFSLGEQFLAREPFIGRTRVALENQIQGYEDRLLVQQARP